MIVLDGISLSAHQPKKMMFSPIVNQRHDGLELGKDLLKCDYYYYDDDDDYDDDGVIQNQFVMVESFSQLHVIVTFVLQRVFV